MASHLRIKPNLKPAIVITRVALLANKLVYVARANKAHRYRWGESHIVYIGTTKAGVHRIAGSAASKASMLLGKWGIRQLEFYIVQSSKLQNAETWRMLERALLITFKEMFGDVPVANKQGKNMRWHQKGNYFREDKLRKAITDFS